MKHMVIQLSPLSPQFGKKSAANLNALSARQYAVTNVSVSDTCNFELPSWCFVILRSIHRAVPRSNSISGLETCHHLMNTSNEDSPTFIYHYKSGRIAGYGSDSAIAVLVAALNARLGSDVYAAREVTTNGGIVGTDAISVKFIYKPATFTPVSATSWPR